MFAMKRLEITMVDHTHVEERDDESYRRYCPECSEKTEPTFRRSTADTYHDEDVSAVICGTCGHQLGHCTWWPTDGG